MEVELWISSSHTGLLKTVSLTDRSPWPLVTRTNGRGLELSRFFGKGQWQLWFTRRMWNTSISIELPESTILVVEIFGLETPFANSTPVFSSVVSCLVATISTETILPVRSYMYSTPYTTTTCTGNSWRITWCKCAVLPFMTDVLTTLMTRRG